MVVSLLLGTLIFQLTYCSIVQPPKCDMIVSETLIDGMEFEEGTEENVPTWKVWSDLITNSNKSIKIASFYWSLLTESINTTASVPGSEKGTEIFNMLKEHSKYVPLEIVQNNGAEQSELLTLLKNELVKVHYINFERLLKRGIQHSKVWIGDDMRTYIGSANMDWRSLSLVKELGVYLPDCKGIVRDVERFWEAMKLLSGSNAVIPNQWPQDLDPSYNHEHPMRALVNGVPFDLYIATSPPTINPPHRTDDLTAVLRTISRAKKYVFISVMNLLPLSIGYGKVKDTFWTPIENELKRSAIDRKVSVKLLISWWNYSGKNMLEYLRSLETLSNIKGVDIDVRMFIVPGYEKKDIPHSRVSHSKYMVTDNTFYIGTSNWSGDYFDYTGGLSIIAEEVFSDMTNGSSVREQLKNVFNRDWNSEYAHELW